MNNAEYERFVSECYERLLSGMSSTQVYNLCTREGLWEVDSIEYALDEAKERLVESARKYEKIKTILEEN